MGPDDDSVGERLDELRLAAWSVGDVAFSGDGGLVWVVTGPNGENLIRASGPTLTAAWLAAYGQARALGMLGRRAMPSDGRGKGRGVGVSQKRIVRRGEPGPSRFRGTLLYSARIVCYTLGAFYPQLFRIRLTSDTLPSGATPCDCLV
jgi:hypothetical protein